MLSSGPARAQIVEVPTFTAVTPAPDYQVVEADVTAGPDGIPAFLWVEMTSFSDYASGKAFTRRVSPQGLPLGPALRVDTTGWVNFDVPPTISPDGSGGYVAAWNILNRLSPGSYLVELYAAFLNSNAVPIGRDFEVGPSAQAPEIGLAVGDTAVGRPAGAAFAWIESPRIVGRLYDTGRQPVGAAFDLTTMGSSSGPQYLDVDVTRDGGFVVAWSEVATAESWALVLAPDGQPRGTKFLLDAGVGSSVQRIAASPLGALAAMGRRSGATSSVWVRRFDESGGFVGEDVIDAGAADSVRGDLAFDENGNLLAVWTEERYSQFSSIARARGYDAAGTPVGPSVTLDPAATIRSPRVAPLSGGRFVIGWYNQTAVQATIVSLCTPGTAVCGDGVQVSLCEQCDDGAANSDTLPDACRTDCRRARCGDGVSDTGEQCEDGNTQSGDCCSWSCRIEPDFDLDGVCDPGDNCRLFPNPDQTAAGVCDAAPFPGVTDAQEDVFTDGLEDFASIETPESGLGPVFNGTSCAECHHRPTIGGSSERFVTRFGRLGPGGAFDPMTEAGGSLLQSEGITTGSCSVPGETLPAEATVVTQRDTPPLFGLGLVDAIADERILKRADPADWNGDGISGRANMVGGRVGRFGWKAQAATLGDFAAEAYRNEIGITTPAFPDESAPQGGPVSCDPVPDPEDDGTDVAAFTSFISLLAPLPTGALSDETRLGKRLFKRIRCHDCHTDKLRTDFSAVPVRPKRVKVFSDFLLHEMGPGLADGIAQGDASGSEFRTAPLWGARESAPYLHDGRVATLEDAIGAHGGEAQAARDRFLLLLPSEKTALLAYLNSL